MTVGHRLGDVDEMLIHQTPEPVGTVAGTSRHWRESYFFVLHHPDVTGDVLILTMSSRPSHDLLDSYLMGHVDGEAFFSRWSRPVNAAPERTEVGPVSVQILEPYRRVRLRVEAGPDQRIGLNLTWTARTAPYLTDRGSMTVGERLVWDQRQMFQSGWINGEYSVDGVQHPVHQWWGQRDHSWGVRDHRRVPCWMWLAIQLPDGMLGIWCWEYSDGSRCFTDGCWAGTDGSTVPVIGFEHALSWVDGDGTATEYHGGGASVAGLTGRVWVDLSDGRHLVVDGRGTWAARYGRRGGGLQQMHVRTDDGRHGTAIFEITGANHGRYFPGPARRTTEDFPQSHAIGGTGTGADGSVE